MKQKIFLPVLPLLFLFQRYLLSLFYYCLQKKPHLQKKPPKKFTATQRLKTNFQAIGF